MEPAWTTMGIVYARGASSNNMGVSVREKEILDTYRRLSVALIIALISVHYRQSLLFCRGSPLKRHTNSIKMRHQRERYRTSSL